MSASRRTCSRARSPHHAASARRATSRSSARRPRRCLQSARVARDIGIDRLLGGTQVEEILAILDGSAVAVPAVPGPAVRSSDEARRLARRHRGRLRAVPRARRARASTCSRIARPRPIRSSSCARRGGRPIGGSCSSRVASRIAGAESARSRRPAPTRSPSARRRSMARSRRGCGRCAIAVESSPRCLHAGSDRAAARRRSIRIRRPASCSARRRARSRSSRLARRQRGGAGRRPRGRDAPRRVSDRNTYAARRPVERALGIAVHACSRSCSTRAARRAAEIARVVARRVDPRTDAVVAVGSGTLNDLCKMVALAARLSAGRVRDRAVDERLHVAVSASITDGRPEAVVPRAHAGRRVLRSRASLAAAPPRLIRAGLGDSAVPLDRAGRLAARAPAARSPVSRGAVRAARRRRARAARSTPARSLAATSTAMRHLVRTLVLSGFGMTICGGSYPASQGEHLISHYARDDAAARRTRFTASRSRSRRSRWPRSRIACSNRDAAPVLRPPTRPRRARAVASGSLHGEACWRELAAEAPRRDRPDGMNARLRSRLGRDPRSGFAASPRPARQLRAALSPANAPIHPAELGRQRCSTTRPARPRDPRSLHVPRSRR